MNSAMYKPIKELLMHKRTPLLNFPRREIKAIADLCNQEIYNSKDLP